MKIPPARIDAFIKSPDKAVTAALLYGPDAGLLTERSKLLAKAITDMNDPFSYTEFSYDKIKADPALLADEIAALSFSQNRRFIKIKDAAAQLDKSVKEVLENAKGEAFVLFCASDLPPASTLRKFFESAPYAAALPCYVDDQASIRSLIAQTLQPFSCEPGVVDYLQQCFSGDRLVIRSELEKLCVYLGDKNELSLRDVKAIVKPSAEFSLNDISYAIASCDAAKAEKIIKQALQEGTSMIAILRVLGMYFLRLQWLKGMVAQGMSEDKAIDSLRPPVFFKDKPLVKRHLTSWTAEGINKVLMVLEQAEKECKRTSMPADIIGRQLLLSLPFYRKQSA